MCSFSDRRQWMCLVTAFAAVLLICETSAVFADENTTDNPTKAENSSQVRMQLCDQATQAGWLKGVRTIELIRNDILSVTIDSGITGAIAPTMYRADADVTRHRALLERYTEPGMFTISSPTDPAYQTPVHPAKVGQCTYEGRNRAGGGEGLPACTIFNTDCFLFLPTPMKPGHRYIVEVNAPDQRDPRLIYSIGLDYDDAKTTTKVIKINQVAYSSLAHERYAYLGWWAGNQGKVDYAAFKTFEVINDKTGQVALHGEVHLRFADEPKTGEDIYELNLASLPMGSYHIRIHGLGCSDPFTIGGKGIYDLYYHTMRAFFYQRCGQEFKEPWTWVKKPACHTEFLESGLVPQGSPGLLHQAKGSGWQQTAQPRPGEQIRTFHGGYHDAADFDVFTYHLPAASQLMTLYEIFPDVFRDKDLDLPESGNGIPDILDEAAWGVSGFIDLQNPDGSMPLGRGNLEDAFAQNTSGKIPPFGVLPPSDESTPVFAAVAAQFARVIRPFDQVKSDRYLKAAEKAFSYASTHTPQQTYEIYSTAACPLKPPQTKNFGAYPAACVWAAAELFRATKMQQYADYLAAQESQNLRSTNYNYTAMRLWAIANADGADPAIVDRAKHDLMNYQNDPTFTNPYRMSFVYWNKFSGWWGSMQGIKIADMLLRNYALTQSQRTLDTLCLNADWHLGCNPRSQTFITNMGYRFPHRPEISYFLYENPDHDLDGHTVRGISVFGIGPALTDWFGKWPEHRSWRDAWGDNAEVYSEFTVSATLQYAAVTYATLYALEKRAGTIPPDYRPNPLDR